MTPDRRKFVILSSLILCAMLPCAFFSLRHGPHHAAFGFAFYGLLLITTWQNIRYNLKHRRQRDTLIHLFPVPSENSQERS
jgi:uncharacterized membrane protein